MVTNPAEIIGAAILGVSLLTLGAYGAANRRHHKRYVSTRLDYSAEAYLNVNRANNRKHHPQGR